MAFSSAVLGKVKAGDKWVVWGSFNSASATGGDINTLCRICELMMVQHGGSAVEANVVVVNETMPCDGSAVTIVVNTSDTGYWYAICRD